MSLFGKYGNLKKDMITLSNKEVYRQQILCELNEKRLNRRKAAECLGISLRQLDRIKKSYADHGLAGLAHKNRGKASNRAMSEKRKKEIMYLIKSHYSDFKPTLASEKLFERHQIKVSREKLRQLMIAEGIWASRKQKKGKAYSRRTRRPRRGELLQGDASPHDWFEGRGPECNLVSFIDDATGHVTAFFAMSETTNAYFELLHTYIKEYGRPQALYVDKNSIFKTSNKKSGEVGPTQFGRALRDLNIELIFAHSPQAKGRIERSYKTFQDRVIKEMRLAEVSSIKEANEFLSWYLPIYNDRFSKVPAVEENAHRAVPFHVDLYKVLSHQETRKLSKSLDFSYKSEIYQVINEKSPRRLAGQMITIYKGIDEKMWVEHKGRQLEVDLYREFKEEPRVMDRKQLDAWLNKKSAMTAIQRKRRKIATPY